jgi:uncharacterized membrane protein YkvA (DUF1232 family)
VPGVAGGGAFEHQPVEDLSRKVRVSIADRLRTWARKVKRDGVTLWFAGRHPQAPWYAKALGAFVVAYALSPIDLIPDFIPVLGYLDDVILLPALIWVAIRMIPAPVLAECREQADRWMATEGAKPSSRIGAALIVVVWIGTSFAFWQWVIKPWLGR